MPAGFSDFDGSIAVQRACRELGLDDVRCAKLQGMIGSICGTARARGGGAKTKREPSKWQECIASRRKGKKFDPQAIKELAKEYRAGKCPP